MTFFSHSNDTHAATAFCAMQGNVDDILLAGQVGGGTASLLHKEIPCFSSHAHPSAFSLASRQQADCCLFQSRYYAGSSLAYHISNT